MRGTIVGVFVLAFLMTAGVASAQKTTLPGVSSGTLVLQLDADVNVNATGSLLNSWSDANGNGISFNRSVGDPSRVAGAINGQSVIRFNSGNGYDRLIDPSFGFSGLTSQLSGQQLTIFAVTQNVTKLNGLLDSYRNHSASLRYAFDIIQIPGGGPITDIIADPTGSVSTFRLSLQDNPSTGPVSNVRTFESFLRTDTFGGLYDQDFAADANMPHFFGEVEMGTINNNGAGAANNLNGDVAEFIIYRGALSATDRANVEQALAMAYSVPEPTGIAVLSAATVLLSRRRRV